MSHAELSARQVIAAAGKARKKLSGSFYEERERLGRLIMLATAVMSGPSGHDLITVSAYDFALMAEFWEPSITSRTVPELQDHPRERAEETPFSRMVVR